MEVAVAAEVIAEAVDITVVEVEAYRMVAEVVATQVAVEAEVTRVADTVKLNRPEIKSPA